MRKAIITAAIALASVFAPCGVHAVESFEADSIPVVYHIRDISPESLVRAFQALEHTPGSPCAIVVSRPASAGAPAVIDDALTSRLATLLGADVLTPGESDSQVELPVEDGYFLKSFAADRRLLDYGDLVLVSQFRGDTGTGYAGALSCLGLDCASPSGRAKVLAAGGDNPDGVLESISDAAMALASQKEGRIVYINVACNIQTDLDGNPYTDEPPIGDLGIFASFDPVAADRACLDAAYNAKDPGIAPLFKFIESKDSEHLPEAAELAGLGSTQYFLITLE